MIFMNLIFEPEVVKQRLRAGMVSHHEQQASKCNGEQQHRVLWPAYNLNIAPPQASTEGLFQQTQAITLTIPQSRSDDTGTVRMNYCCSLELFRNLFHKVLLKQILRPLRTLLSQQDRFCFRGWIGDVTFLIETIERIPIVSFPRSPVWFVSKCSQIQQGQYNLVNLFFVYFHEAPLCRNMERSRKTVHPCHLRLHSQSHGRYSAHGLAWREGHSCSQLRVCLWFRGPARTSALGHRSRLHHRG